MILIVGFLVGASAADSKRTLQPGINYIRVTTQVIKRDKKGDIRFSTSAIYNKYISPFAIGNSVTRCAFVGKYRTFPNGSQICTTVFRMPYGQIVATGFVASPVYYTIPVVGGTGLYANIGGQVQSTATRLVPRKEKLTFVIYSIRS